jgi:hypothetical protein
MKNLLFISKISPLKSRGLLCTLILTFLFFYQSEGQSQDWKEVQKALGRNGALQANIFKTTMPRSDLKIKIDGYQGRACFVIDLLGGISGGWK